MTGHRKHTWVALLRGVNVGRAKRVAMADLRSLLEGLGYTQVRTLLNSGNAVFSAPTRSAAAALAPTIEAAMSRQLGVDARVFVVAADTLAAVLAANPLRERADDDAKLLVAVFAPVVERAALGLLAARDWTPDAFAFGPDAAYLWCASGVLASPLSQAFGKALGDQATARNWATMTRLAALAGVAVPA